MKLKKSKIDIQAVDKQLTFDKEDSQEALPDPTNYQIVYGLISQKGGGKSTVLWNLIKDFYKKKFDNIFMICPSKDAKFQELIDELVEENKFYDLEDDTFSNALIEIYEKLQTIIQDDKKSDNLLILDDCMADFQGSKILEKLVANSRHLRLTIFYTSQYFRKVPPVLRSNTDVYSIWNTNNKLELKKYEEELNVNADYFHSLMKLVQAHPHSFITISFVGGRPRFFFKFDEIIKD